MSSRFLGLAVTCDDPWHAGERVQKTATAADVNTARAALRRDGWSFSRRGEAVYCPTCTANHHAARQPAD